MPGTPDEGLESIAEDAYLQTSFNHTLRLFTNPVNSIADKSATLSDFIQANEAGYNSIVLNPAQDYEIVDQNEIVFSKAMSFIPTEQWVNVITGAYIQVGNKIRHYGYLRDKDSGAILPNGLLPTYDSDPSINERIRIKLIKI